MQHTPPTSIRILPTQRAHSGVAANADGGGLAFTPPQRMTQSAAGFDLTAALDQAISLMPQERRLIPCGFRMEMPEGTEAQIRPRSGLAVKYGITCLNAPGTIDADFRGEVHVLLINHGQQPFVVEPGMRIAQMVFARLAPVRLELADSLAHSERGERGFGSTGS